MLELPVPFHINVVPAGILLAAIANGVTDFLLVLGHKIIGIIESVDDLHQYRHERQALIAEVREQLAVLGGLTATPEHYAPRAEGNTAFVAIAVFIDTATAG